MIPNAKPTIDERCRRNQSLAKRRLDTVGQPATELFYFEYRWPLPPALTCPTHHLSRPGISTARLTVPHLNGVVCKARRDVHELPTPSGCTNCSGFGTPTIGARDPDNGDTYPWGGPMQELASFFINEGYDKMNSKEARCGCRHHPAAMASAVVGEDHHQRRGRHRGRCQRGCSVNLVVVQPRPPFYFVLILWISGCGGCYCVVCRKVEGKTEMVG